MVGWKYTHELSNGNEICVMVDETTKPLPVILSFSDDDIAAELEQLSLDTGVPVADKPKEESKTADITIMVNLHCRFTFHNYYIANLLG